MTVDEVTPQAGTQTDAAPAVAADAAKAVASPPAQDAEDVNALPGWAQSLVRELRSENAKHRKAKTEAERVAAEQADTAAKEQGRWQQLAEKYEPQAKRTAALEKFIADWTDQEIASVPDRLKGLIPEFDDPLKRLEWVRRAKAEGVFAPPQAPNTNAADTRPGPARLSEAEKRERAAQLGVDWRYLPD